MCGPSSALKSINANIQSFATQVQTEAKDIYGDASSVFNTIMDSVTGILKGGPSQYGFSAGEQAAKTAAAVQAGGAEARNLKGAAAATAGAIGGGNVVTPAGTIQAETLSAEQKAAADTAASLNAVTQEGYQRGNENFWKGESVASKATDVFNPAIAANADVTKAQHEAETSQQNIDTQSNWAMNDVMKLAPTAIGMVTGGFGNMGEGSGAGSFISGMFGQNTPAPGQ